MVNYNGSSAGKLTSSGNQVDNIYFSYSGNWTPEKKIYWKDKSTKADFFCYFPYKSNIANVAALPIAVKENQSSEENYKASEFLWGKTTGVTPTESTVNITLEYANSKLIIKLVAGEGYSQEDLKSAEVVIGELKLEATINLATGEVAAKGNASDIKPKMENDLYHALVIPQSAENIDLIKVTIDNKTYLLNQSIDFASNKQYTCTINIDRSSQGVVIGIEGWDIDDREYGNEIGNI